MSKQVDERVVSMQFDNKQFEANVATTMSTLEKFKQKLNLSGATKGLSDVDAAAKKVDMSGLSGGIETVRAKFSALEVMGVTALANITNSAVNAGKRITSALTIDPIKTGFQEYETQMGAVQTILANTQSKGSTLDDVNKALDSLNTYADKTIYNFTEMTRNIGTFTAAGVDLQTSVDSIQGIANLAAVSGSTSQQASTAMYQLSQALAAGKVSLMDWNSVVNAGMGGELFQNALIRTSELLKTGAKDAIDTYGSFRESLSRGEWLTSEVLTETLKQISGAYSEADLVAQGYTKEQAADIAKLAETATSAATEVKTATQLWDTLKESAQSGWTQSWEIIIGDFTEAKGLFTEISNKIGGMIGESAEARNKLLTGTLSTGWKQLLSQGIDDAAGFEETVSEVAKKHGVKLDDMIKKEGSFQDTLKNGWLNSDILTESINKFTAELSGMSEEELKAAGYTEETVTKMETLCKQVKDGTISMEEFSKAMARPSGRELLIESLWNAFEGITSIITPVKEAFREIFPAPTAAQLYSLIEKIHEFTQKLTISGDTADKIKRTFKGVFAVLDIGVQAVKAIAGGFMDLLKHIAPAGGGLLDFTANVGDFLVQLRDSVRTSNLFKNAIKGIVDFIKTVADGVKKFAKLISEAFGSIADTAEVRFEPLVAIGNFIKGVFTGLGNIISKVLPFIAQAAGGIVNVVKSLIEKVTGAFQNADYDSIFDIANGGIITAIGVFIAKFIKSGGDLLDNAGGFIESFKDILGGVSDALGAFTDSLKANTLKKIAISIGILAASLLVLSLIDSDKLSTSLVAISTLFAELMISMGVFTKMTDGSKLKGLAKISSALIGLATAVFILSIALKIMSTMTWGEMAVGLIALTVGIGVLVAAVNLLPEKKVNGAAKAMKKMATALLVLSVALKIMSSMTWGELAVGLTAMVVGLGALVAAVNLLPKDTMLRAAGMISLATAMVILGAALKIMASMSWEEVAKSLVSLAGSLSILAVAMRLMKGCAGGAMAMLIIAPALTILGGALKIMASMSWEEITKGLVSLAGSLVVIAAAMHLMKGTLAGAAALLVVTAALAVLAPVLKVLGSMTWGDIARGLVAMAGAFAVIGIAGALLKPLVPTILALSGAITLLGIACLAMGMGIAALGIGLTTIAASGTAIAVAITAIGRSIIGLIPYLIEQIGVGIIKLCETISGGAAAICEAVAVIIVAIVDALVASVPALIEGALVLIDSLLSSLASHTPSIVASLMDFLIAVLNGVAEKLPDLIKAGVNLVMSLFSGIVDALKSIDPSVLVNGLVGVGMLTGLMAALAAVASLTPAAMTGVLGMGVVAAELAIVLAAIGALAQIPGLEWLINEGGNFLQSIGTAIGQFFGGIVGGIAQGMTASLPKIGTDLSAFMISIQPFILGAKMIDPAALEGVKTLTGIIVALTAANIFESLTSFLTGGSSLIKFGEQIAAFAPNIKKYADTVKGIDASAVTASANAAKALSELASNLPNSGGLAGLFAGENDIGEFGKQLAPFGEGLMAYSQAVSGIDANAITNSVTAAKSLVELSNNIPNEGGLAAWIMGDNSISKFGDDLEALGKGLARYSELIAEFDAEAVTASANAANALVQMTNNIPNEGGIVSWFTGDNSVSSFADQLSTLGSGLADYSNAIADFDAEAVVASANAAKAITDMANTIPNQGGLVSWFTGDNSIAQFGGELKTLGTGLKDFSTEVAGVVPENIVAAANAAKALAEMASIIPNEGGVVSWFTGDNSIAQFGGELKSLGTGLKDFATEVSGIEPESVTAAATAAKSLAEMANTIPNEGGVASWFAGDNSVAQFSGGLKSLGTGLKDFGTEVAGIEPESITAAATAAKSISDLVSVIPNEGGISAWFGGEKSVANFGEGLKSLGTGLKGFATEVSGIEPESTTAASTAAKNLADLISVIPNEGGIGAWFGGEKSVAKFGGELKTLGTGLKGFATEVAGIEPESTKSAASVAKSLAEMTNTLPNQGGIGSWFGGEKSMSSFSGGLKSLGTGLKGFATEVAGIEPESTKAAASVAKTLAEMTNTLPNEGGMGSWFGGEKSVASFSGNLKSLGAGIKGFATEVAGIESASVTTAANAAKTLADMSNTIPDGTDKLTNFGNDLKSFGDKLSAYFTSAGKINADSITASTNAVKSVNAVTKIEASKVTSAADAISKLVKALTSMAGVTKESTSGFSQAITELGKTSVDSLIKAFKNAETDLQKCGKTAIDAYIKGLKSKTSAAKTAFTSIADACSKAVSNKKSSFETAGKNLVQGFASGISANTYLAEAKAKAMANAAEKAAKEALDINSPSKVFRALGYSVPEGFAMGIDRMMGLVAGSSGAMADTAINSVSSAISKVADYVNTGIDAQPTIRPVLDLSDVKSQAGSISGLFSMRPSVGVLSNVGTISSMMNSRQNGTTNDVISAIDGLRKSLGNTSGDNYNINGITYDDGSNVSEAVRTLVRAARIERRI